MGDQSATGHKIATKFLIWFLLVALVPLAIVGLVTYRISKDALRAEADQSLAAILEAKINQVEAFVRDRTSDVTTSARNPTIVEAMRRFDAAFRKGGLDSPEYAACDQECRPFLAYYSEAYGYADLFLVSPSGDAVFSVKRGEDLGSNYCTGPYRHSELAKVVDRAKTLLETEVSDFEHYPATNEPAAFIAAPIFQNGGLIGVIVLQMSNAEVYRLVQDYTGLGETGETVVCAKAGNRAVFVTPLRHDPHAAFRRRVEFGSEEARPAQRAAEGLKGSGLFIDYRGREVLAAWRYSPHLRWGVVVKIDTAEAFAPIVTLRNRVAGIGLIVLALVAAASLLVSRSISRPITKLTDVAQTIAGGDLTKRVEVLSHDEIGQLAQSFNEMTGKLDETYSDLVEHREHLEELVEERTAELSGKNEQLEQEMVERRRAQEVITKQAQEILDLSTPVMQIWKGVVVAPLIGALDSGRTQQFMERLLNYVAETDSEVALVDVTGVPTLDTKTAQHLLETIRAVRLLGARVVLTGVRPAIAQTVVQLGVDLSEITTRSSLAAGLRAALEMLERHGTEPPEN